MITEKIIREQTPDEGFDWLYEEQSDGTRNFARRVLLGIHAVEWKQCTSEEKEAWEEEQRKKAEEAQDAEESLAAGDRGTEVEPTTEESSALDPEAV